MRQMLERVLDGRPQARRRALVAAMALSAPLMALGLATSAFAASPLKAEFAIFANCPVETAKLCTVATTKSGEFKLDLKTTPIVNPTVLQGGLASEAFAVQPLIPPTNGETLSKTAQPVPGGLTGLSESVGGPVTATAELAGPASGVTINKFNLLAQEGTAVTLPIKVKLDNELLGNECYIGSDSEPIMLNLTTGTTSPSLPNQPITGSRGTIEGAGKGKIVKISGNSLVDNNFAVPGASGCGGESESTVLDLVVDAGIGIPAPAGLNAAILSGELEETNAIWAAKYKPKVKKPKKEKPPKK
jgi:hypothetical protein